MSTETRKILEQIFTGQMPVKRNNPKPGQSPFYYVAFQSDDNDEEPIAADGADNNGLGESSGDRKTFLPAEGVSGFLPAVPSLTEPMPAGGVPFVAEPYFLQETGQDEREKERKAADAALKALLIGEEGNVPHMYLDTVGDVTYCVGHRSASPEEAARCPWYKEVSGSVERDRTNLADRDRVFHTHRYVQTLPYGQNYGAGTFEDKSDLRLPPDYCLDLLERDLAERRRNLQKTFPNYDKMSPYLQNSLLEVNFNIGNISPEKWPGLYKAAQEKDVESFCKNLHRKTTDSKGKPIANMPKRNAWNLENCLKGRFSD